MASPRRWQRRKTARPQEILEAAMAVFAQKGFAAARMEDIAARAGVAKGTIYLYFDTKEAVFKALVRESIGGALGRVNDTLSGFDGPSALLLHTALSTVAQLIVMTDRVVLPKIVLAEAGNFPDIVRFYRDEIIDRGLAMLGAIVQRGIDRQEFRAVTPRHAAMAAIAPLLLAAFWRNTFAQFDTEPFDYEGFIATHLDMLLRGLARQGEPV